MRPLLLVLMSLSFVLTFGSEASEDSAPPPPPIDNVVTYYDRNGDGKVDFELHHAPHAADADWALVDTRFSEYYDVHVDFGYAVTRERVHIRVPRHVHITRGQPPVSDPNDQSCVQRRNPGDA